MLRGRARKSSAPGFTLIEMMIVVAVVAILASLAVPAYFTMLRRAHRVEGQALLGGLYSLESAFYAENRRYGCLPEVGFRIEGDGHFAVWVCDDPGGCTCPAGGACTPDCCVCPCVDAPNTWNAEVTADLGVNPAEPVAVGTPDPSPLELPDDCAAVMAAPYITGATDNWCRRAVPEVVDILWFTSETGREIYYDPLVDDPPQLADCF